MHGAGDGAFASVVRGCVGSSGFKRWNGVVLWWSSCRTAARARSGRMPPTFAATPPVEPTPFVLDGEGIRGLMGCWWRCSGDAVLQGRANRFGLSLVRANDFGKVNLFARLESSP